jgi:hypothetical protein
MGFVVITAVTMKITVFCNVTPCSLGKMPPFGGNCFLVLQSKIIPFYSESSNTYYSEIGV